MAELQLAVQEEDDDSDSNDLEDVEGSADEDLAEYEGDIGGGGDDGDWDDGHVENVDEEEYDGDVEIVDEEGVEDSLEDVDGGEDNFGFGDQDEGEDESGVEEGGAGEGESSDSASDISDEGDAQFEEINIGLPLPENPEEREELLLELLRKWALRGVSFKKVNSLLKILHNFHPILPLSSKTLLGTPRRNETDPLGNGKFWYKGIAVNIRQRYTIEKLEGVNEIVIDVSIDGLDPFKSTFHCFWPILGSFPWDSEPFIIAMYFGLDKPDNVDTFLEQYVVEATHLLEHGIQMFGKHYGVKLRDYVLDAEARAFIKCIIHHGGRFACEKCEVEGQFILRREVFLNMDAPLRTDNSFRDRTNPLHHTGDPTLEQIPTGMVSQFRLDGMHLLHLGVSKRWLRFLLGTSKRRGLLNEAKINEIEELRELVASHIPLDFNRRPRPLKYLSKYKATELRRVMLYDGLVIFQKLPKQLWKNYRLYHACLYIMSSPVLVREMLNVATLLVRRFITHSRKHLGRHFIVYNVHSMLHMPKECEEHGTIDDFSAFKYENYFGVITNYLRSTNKALEQLMNRDAETKGRLMNPHPPPHEGDVTLSQKKGENIDGLVGEQYLHVKLHRHKIFLKISEADCCFETHDGTVAVLRNILLTPAGGVRLYGHRFTVKEDYYTYPINSSLLGIWKVSSLDAERRYWDMIEFAKKCVLLPCRDSNEDDENEDDDNGNVDDNFEHEVFVSIPLLHTGEP